MADGILIPPAQSPTRCAMAYPDKLKELNDHFDHISQMKMVSFSHILNIYSTNNRHS